MKNEIDVAGSCFHRFKVASSALVLKTSADLQCLFIRQKRTTMVEVVNCVELVRQQMEKMFSVYLQIDHDNLYAV
jgi:hypothetical protein